MRVLKVTLISIGISAAVILTAQEPSALSVAKAIDQEILKLGDLPYDAQARAIKDLALRIRQQPKDYTAALAFNLAVDATGACDRDTLQEVTTTLVDAIRRTPARYIADSAFLKLAELARYEHMQVSMDHPRYTAAIAKLEADDEHRGKSDFTLTDLQDRKWNLKGLRGKVVLVHFWATWCPPCRAEIPDLNALYERFRDQGLVILGISGEESSTLKSFLDQQKVGYPVLLDPGDKVKELFRVRGVPKSLVYDRDGRLVAQTIDSRTMQGFLEMLGEAGLR